MIRVLIKASSAIAKAGLEALLRAHPSFYLVDEPSEAGSTAVTPSGQQPDVVLAEIEDRDDEVAQEMFDWAASGASVILLVPHPAAEWIAKVLREGVKAALPSNLTGPEIVAAIEAAATGLVVLHPSDLEVLVPSQNQVFDEIVPPIVEPLTAREIEVLRLLALGLANKEIAARLEVSEHTVKFHVASIMGKLGASSRTEAVTLGIRHGIVMI